jgi:2,6-dihydroxypseudooxynicotine hydrolase
MDEARQHATTLSLEGVAQNITCPLYIVSGKRDRVIPWQHAERLSRDASGEVVFNLVEDGNHIANNRPHRWRPQSADWLARQLGAVTIET